MISFKTNIDDIFIVIPAKNEDRYVDKLINHITDLGYTKIVLVNDCSTDNTRKLAESHKDVVVLDHIINLGAGASTQTGIAYAVRKNAKIIVTIDADLQHNPNDISTLIYYLENEKCDLVIGSRFLQINNIPRSRIIFNKIANYISYLLTGLYLTDSQSGLKAIEGSLAKKLNLNYDGFEFCMEIIKQAKSINAKIKELPIDVRYTLETTKKGQNLWSGINMIARILSPFN